MKGILYSAVHLYIFQNFITIAIINRLFDPFYRWKNSYWHKKNQSLTHSYKHSTQPGTWELPCLVQGFFHSNKLPPVISSYLCFNAIWMLPLAPVAIFHQGGSRQFKYDYLHSVHFSSVLPLSQSCSYHIPKWDMKQESWLKKNSQWRCGVHLMKWGPRRGSVLSGSVAPSPGLSLQARHFASQCPSNRLSRNPCPWWLSRSLWVRRSLRCWLSRTESSFPSRSVCCNWVSSLAWLRIRESQILGETEQTVVKVKEVDERLLGISVITSPRSHWNRILALIWWSNYVIEKEETTNVHSVSESAPEDSLTSHSSCTSVVKT